MACVATRFANGVFVWPFLSKELATKLVIVTRFINQHRCKMMKFRFLSKETQLVRKELNFEISKAHLIFRN